MTFAIFAVHAFANSTGAISEFCRTGSKEVAEALVDKLKKERIRVHGEDGKTRTVRRYSFVEARQVS